MAILRVGPASTRNRSRKPSARWRATRSEEHTSELQSRRELVCRLLLEKKNDGRVCGGDERLVAVGVVNRKPDRLDDVDLVRDDHAQHRKNVPQTKHRDGNSDLEASMLQ